MNWYSKATNEVLGKLSVSKARGLDSKEALSRLETHGLNRLEAKKPKSLFRRFLAQLNDFMVLILIGAAILSLLISWLDGDADFADPIIIMAIVLLNSFLGLMQESRAERAIDSLKKLSAPKTSVLRDGNRVEIESDNIVSGDIIFLETGDRVTADARIIEGTGLRAEESSLTGESVPSDKSDDLVLPPNAPLGERRNMVFSGSSIVAGRGMAVVTDTGMQTEVGKIARLLDTAENPDTPLQRRLTSIGKVLAIAALILCGIVFLLGLLNHTPLLDSFMLSVSLAVAAVPEGLPAIVTIVLALGVQKLVDKNAIVRRLPAVETLGSATVICSDKTGTLTQNRMKVVRTWTFGSSLKKELLSYGMLCSNSVMDPDQKEAVGDPTENAIVNAAYAQGLRREELERKSPRTAEMPFDSGRKLMSTVHRASAGNLLITKGAPDILLPLCTHFESGSGTQPMTAAFKNTVRTENANMAGEALRVIAVAYRHAGAVHGRSAAALEQDLTFLGLIAMIDPPRPEAKEAVALCRRAGIRPVMITGDHAATAKAIAKELGMLSGGVMTGGELDALDDKELKKTVSSYSVFARVTPEHKSRVVKALQANGEIVAMTGDGVNDAPALKTADIGCAMGKSGTDVARDASDMILTDDNFATIVSAVREGRGIYDNICKCIYFLLSCNVGEILTILLAFLMDLPSPLLPIHLLWINLVTDSLPALALGSEKPDRDIMDRKPVKPGSSMFSGGKGVDILVQGVMVGVLALAAFFIGMGSGDYMLARTYTFAVLSLSQLVHAFNIRSNASLFSIGVFSNPRLVGSFVICAAMQISVICVPALNGLFKTMPLDAHGWQIVAALSVAPLIIMEIGKLISRGKDNHSYQNI